MSVSKSIKARFISSLGSISLRQLLSFLTSVVIARSLLPQEYGNYIFLVSFFVAARSLLDFGTSSTFFSTINRKKYSDYFYKSYWLWISLQFIGSMCIVYLAYLLNIAGYIWLDINILTVLLALAAVFMQQIIWQTVVQLAESERKTVSVQLIGVGIAALILFAIVGLSLVLELSINLVFFIVFILYFLGISFAIKIYQLFKFDLTIDIRFVIKYWRLGLKNGGLLPILTLVFFFSDVGDRWMLQYFGGGDQQAYYGIASQFSTIVLLVTTSIINIFWKEISELHKANQNTMLFELYNKVSIYLILTAALIASALLPWAPELVAISFGNNYIDSAPVMIVFLLIPIYQSIGQINGTMLLAQMHYNTYIKVGVLTVIISLALSYIILSTTQQNDTSIYLAVKNLFMNFLSVNAVCMLISRMNNRKFDFKAQLIAVPIIILAGVPLKLLAEKIAYSILPIDPSSCAVILIYSSLCCVTLLAAYKARLTQKFLFK